MKFLLRVTRITLQHTSFVNFVLGISFRFIGTNPSRGTTHIWKADCVGVQENSLAPFAVLDHLLWLLVIKLGDDW